MFLSVDPLDPPLPTLSQTIQDVFDTYANIWTSS